MLDLNKIVSELVRKSLHSDSILSLTAQIGRHLLYRNDRLSFKIWIGHLFAILRDSMLKKKAVVWTSIFIPSELIYAMGCVPFHAEVFALVAAYLNVGPEMIHAGEQEGYSSDLCSCYRCAAGLVSGSFFPVPDLIISSSHLCDGSTAFFRNMAKYYGVPHLLVDVPYGNDKNAEDYVSRQIKDIILQAEEVLSFKFDIDKLRDVLTTSNETRKYYERFNRLREHVPAPFSGSRALTYVSGMMFISMGTHEGYSFSKAICQEVEADIANSRPAIPEEKHRILWLHQVKPYYKNSIFTDLKDRGAVIAAEEITYIYWSPYDLRCPIEALAGRMMENINLGPIERRLNAVRDMVSRYKIDGIIHFSQWGCRQSSGGAYILRRSFIEEGIPFLVLHGDCADPANYAEGQTKTRIQAFLEILEST